MSTFVVSARKYRPVRFEDVVGQEHVSHTLKNALKNDHLAHAFLFCGPRGVGKTTCARILAKVLNCRQVTPEFEPCNTCDSCRSFNENASFNITELDAASNNSVEHIRALIEQVRFQPQQGKYKIFIIDEVHMLSQQAFNAFLKTLEEPPPYAIFILATTEKQKIIPTILSRCQIYDFRRIQVNDTVQHLQAICKEEGIEADASALHIIAQKADGALRDALSIFDRIVSFSGKKVLYDDVISNLNILDYDYFFQVTDALLLEDASRIMLLFDEVLKKGFDADIFINGLSEHLRNLLVCKDEQTLPLLEVSEDVRERYRKQAALMPTSLALTAMNIANDCDIEFKMARNKRLHVEIALIKMTYINRAIQLANTPEAASPENEKKKPEPQPVNTAALSQPELITEAPPVSGKPVPSMAPDDAPLADKPAASIPISGSDKYAAVPKLMSMENMLAELKKEDAPEIHAGDLNLEATQGVWHRYVDEFAKEALRGLMRPAGWQVEGMKLTVKVGSPLAENTIRQETPLMEFLRKELRAPDMMLYITVEKSLAQEMPVKQRPLNAQEKYIKMREVNPVITEFQKRFSLHPDE
ncbi:MAG: DNA polymerase III subunit gamma/tau [Saprospiraceae bacterium]|nr:DNA polymerase III subunit gamma/tau [Saprospiraceae bacterium]MDZ4705139.1 DNA polymerase III subunit gamma/tau [Saprospiraceae bacterium]